MQVPSQYRGGKEGEQVGPQVTPGLICPTCSKFLGICRCQGKCPICGKYRVECGGCKKPKGVSQSREKTPKEKVQELLKPPKAPDLRGGKYRKGRGGIEYGEFCGECGEPESKCTCWVSDIGELIKAYKRMVKGKRKTRARTVLRKMLIKRILKALEAMDPQERVRTEYILNEEGVDWK